MNARDVLREMERLQEMYSSDSPFSQRAEELAIGLALICEDVRTERIRGHSLLEPNFRKAAAIYEELVEEYQTLIFCGDVEEVDRVWPRIR